MVLVKHYKLWIGHPGAGPVVPQTFTGSFSNKTPTKKFTISRLGLKDWNSNPVSLQVNMHITNYGDWASKLLTYIINEISFNRIIQKSPNRFEKGLY